MDICEATNSRLEKDFLEVPKLIYNGDKNWVCPLSVEISNIFDAGKNVSLIFSMPAKMYSIHMVKLYVG